jgi:YggT family protein
MFVAANFISALAMLVGMLLEFYTWVLIARAVLSWVNPDPYNPIVQFLYKITEPVLDPIRQRMGYGMGMDLSPMVVLLIIMFLKQFLVRSLYELASRLQ